MQLEANGSLRVSFQGISEPELFLNHAGHLVIPSLECHDNQSCFQRDMLTQTYRQTIMLRLREIELDHSRHVFTDARI